MSEEKKHWGPATKFAVDRSVPGRTFDAVDGQPIRHEQNITIHWPEIEESKIVLIEESTDSHGTHHARAYFDHSISGAIIRIYLRDVQNVISVQLSANDRRPRIPKIQATEEEAEEYRTHEMTCGS